MAQTRSRPPSETLYDFIDKNPIPDWAHLVYSPDEMTTYLVREMSRQHAERIVQFVYNLDGTLTGSCSNFKAASEVINAFEGRFNLECDRILDEVTK
jgi:hypothetical protein